MSDLIKRLRREGVKVQGIHIGMRVCDEAADRIEQLEAALREIAGQHLSEKMTEDQFDHADWIGGYDALVGIARAALAPEQDK